MGRSQVVRQRILIPPFPGSNPGAPASQCGLRGAFPYFRKAPETSGSCGSVHASPPLQNRARLAPIPPISAPSLRSRIFHIQSFSAETWFAIAETGSRFLLFGNKQTIARNSITSPGPSWSPRVAEISSSTSARTSRSGTKPYRRHCAPLPTGDTNGR